MRAIILARVSHSEQDSNEAQVMRIGEYVKRKELDIWKTYEIEESSTSGDREKFQEIVGEVVRSKEPIALVVDTIDRLQRGFRESVQLEDLRKQGKVVIHFYRENLIISIDSNSADLLRWDMGVMFARAYVLQLSDNVKRKFQKKRADGEWTGHPRIGYIQVQERDANGVVLSRNIVPDRERAHLISRVFELYATGTESITTIHEKITRMGLTSLDGKKVARSNIDLILKDPFYYGMARSKKYGLYPHRYQVLISRDLFDRCEAIRERRGKAPAKAVGKPFVLKGLLHCAKCGCSMTPEIKKGRFVYYSCTNAKGICKRVYVPESELLKPVREIFGAFSSVPQVVHDRLVAELRKTTASEVDFHNKEIARIRAEYDRVQRRVETLLDVRLDGSITQDEYDKKLQDMKTIQYRLNVELEEHTKADHKYYLHVSQVMSLSRRMGEIFESSEPEEKRAILNYLFQNSKVSGRSMSFELKKPFNTVLELSRGTADKREKALSGLPIRTLLIYTKPLVPIFSAPRSSRSLRSRPRAPSPLPSAGRSHSPSYFRGGGFQKRNGRRGSGTAHFFPYEPLARRSEPFECKSKCKGSLVHSFFASGRPAQRGVTLGIRLGHFR